MMIKTLLKCLALGIVLTFTTVTQAQIYQKFPTNVRYIGGGYNNVRPFFKTLESALNDVKPVATAANPYVFWLASDSLWVADWDSVFTASGITMKDSIDLYYVATGKIKWMPSSGSGGGSTIIAQDDSTLHYNWPTWDQTNLALPLWQRQIGAADDSTDEEVWRLIVYTQLPLYIENDTLKLDTTGLGSTSGWNPDTSTVLRTTGTQSSSATNTWSGSNTTTGSQLFSGSGNIQLPASNGATGTPRRIWGTTTNIYYSGAGGAGDTNSIALVSLSTGLLRNVVVGWGNLNSALQDSIQLSAEPINAEFYWYTTDPDTIPLLTGGGWLTVGDWTSGHINDITVTSDSSFTITAAGIYRVSYSLSFTGANSQVVEAGLFIDEALHPGSGMWRKLGTGTDVGNAGTSFIAELAVGELCELKLRSPGVTGDIIVHMGNININRVR